jgi:hypothetical protein
MVPVISIETATKIDPRFPSICVTKYEVLEDGDVIHVFSDPVAAEEFAYAYADEVCGIVEE